MKKIILLMIFIMIGLFVFSEEIVLTTVELSDGTHNYYHELLTKALEAKGHKLTLNIEKSLPQPRIVNYFENEKLSIHWLIQTKERDTKYIPVEVDITNGLTGNRILFIGKNKQKDFDNVKTLEDFRNLNKIGGLGKNWFDVEVWKANNLKYFEKEGEWRDLYKMLKDGNMGIDYFSRGVQEIVVESALHPYLDIEKNIVLIYNKDFRFYLSKSAKKYKKFLEESLVEAKKSGLIDKLIRKYFLDVFDKNKINLDGRIKIKLTTPN
ncbi:MAG: hypothetical protein A2086_12525 [Spirochaetes bacterium GWD1_27_9]|nr:MAG: hypothetical protein A2Z98_10930 [Spirochaetes bacterium GWB1_27_13]OHD28187.1 MAG: hypothetical protein A2Y34_07265 [Spirochaetes bacterium GWC1_27_15]OHD44284.1 MAG: hypothetical protein A2086_12525 [Spirochaetes bacterium GWD1_27_9]